MKSVDSIDFFDIVARGWQRCLQNLPMFQEIFGFELCEQRDQSVARQFYGDTVFELIEAHEKQMRKEAQMRLEASHRMIDDVGQQLIG